MVRQGTRLAIGLFMVLALLLALAGPAAAAPAEKVRVIITFEQLPGAAERGLVSRLGGETRHSYHLVPAIAARVPQAMLPLLAKAKGVKSVEEDGVVQALDQTVPWGVTRIGATAVHPYNRGSGVKVGIIDTGIDLDHADLAVAGGVNYVADGTPPDDDNGHGSHVAGSVAALNNTSGVLGVAPLVSLYAIKVLDAAGSGYWSDVIAGIQWSVDNGMRVINMSLGGSSAPSSLGDAANAAWNAGLVVVAAAGNSGNSYGYGDNVLYPARYDSVIAVAATNSSDQRASFSSTGPKVELAAPGVSIYSTYKNGGYTTLSGTSMASPHVAGVAALVIASGIADSNGNGRVNDEVRTRLQQTADDLGTVGRDSLYGYGLVDADEAAPPGGNQPPVANAGPDQTVSDADGNGSQAVTLNGSASYDPDGSIVSYQWTEGATALGSGAVLGVSLAVGVHPITLTVTDDDGATATDTVQVTVNPNQPPVANAGPDQTVIDNDNNGSETVALNGSASYDPDGSIVGYQWTEGVTSLGSGAAPSVSLAVGLHTVTLTVTDNGGATDTDTVQITVAPAGTPSTMHVDRIDMSLVSRYGGWRFNAAAKVTVVDGVGAPVPGATVSGHWQGATADTDSGATGANGQVTLESDTVRRPPSGTIFTFVVDNVAKTGMTYNPAQNTETQDSIVVP